MSVEAIIEPSDYVAPDTFNQFLADLKARARQTKSPIISPRMFCLALGMDVQTLASRAHVHRVTVNRAQGAEKLQTYLRDAVRVMGAAADINGNFQDAAFWFRNEPISAFNFRTPEQLVSEGRAEDLLNYVQSLHAGAAG
ncbi:MULTISPECIES: hypothetical protein [Halomonadaceae]|jgi:uncharacterized protein (DUF2384 family)|uniref:DUF2384 domain-containing protein n=5 Tax=Vreelandella TaxID=3137766 RepID=A0A433KZK9_9GAMM|nr:MULTISPECIES: hypothetical protein [Halomonadaceae]AJY53055.1 hypothetical protein KO116_P100305 [Halomonas sp. KO116]MBL1270225.1 DUF2384 domain-containing protein [Halomonas sp.]MCH4813549.1 DUF2384 domain-containing protein [Halomonas neptunia]MEA2118820.1 DUF2384 domain-containing protein [Halovibrio sp. HP20-59]NVF16063.1 DUF2384 domain-containing protein [Halomonas maris]|tara:strand:+ start:3493 stop:3912 length:420 start_codon:yes stop_codon:yes gene_type:complete